MLYNSSMGMSFPTIHAGQNWYTAFLGCSHCIDNSSLFLDMPRTRGFLDRPLTNGGSPRKTRQEELPSRRIQLWSYCHIFLRSRFALRWPQCRLCEGLTTLGIRLQMARLTSLVDSYSQC